MREEKQQSKEQKETDLNVGDKAPSFVMQASRERMMTLDSLKGSPFVLYFYPKANTPGCTQEAIDFSNALSEFTNRNVQIIGVSRDTVKKLDLFADKYNLTFPLASDVDGCVSLIYGVWVQKKLYGKTSMGVERATYLIDSQGVIVRIWRKVKVTGHVGDVLSEVIKLQK